MATQHAVVLSGGGAKGAYEIGVMKALLGGHAHAVNDGAAIHPAVYAGTSVGSYNAAYMVSRPDRAPHVALAELEAIWRNRIASSPTRPNGVLRFRFNPLDMLDVGRLLGDPLAPLRNFVADSAFVMKDAAWRAQLFLNANEPLTSRLSTLLDFGAFVSTEAFADLVRGTIDLQAIRANHDQVLIVAATNWEEGVAVLFSNRNEENASSPVSMDEKTGHLAIMASAAIPGVFPAIEVLKKKHVDGGVLLNTPLEPALRGLRHVAPDDEHVLHVIYLDPNLKDIPLGPGHGTMEALNRLFALSFANQVNRDCRHALSINMALEAGADDESAAGASGQARPGLRETVRMKPGHRYSPLTIHRYSPKDLLGGIFGLLAFNGDYVNKLIDQGFRDAVAHDCVASGCIFPRKEDAERVKASKASLS